MDSDEKVPYSTHRTPPSERKLSAETRFKMTQLWNDGHYHAAARVGLSQYLSDMVVSESTFYDADQIRGATALGMRVGEFINHMKAARADVLCQVFEHQILRTEPPAPLEYELRRYA